MLSVDRIDLCARSHQGTLARVSVAGAEADPQAHLRTGNIVRTGICHHAMVAKLTGKQDALYFQCGGDPSTAAFWSDTSPALPCSVMIFARSAVKIGVSHQSLPIISDDTSRRRGANVSDPQGDLFRCSWGKWV